MDITWTLLEPCTVQVGHRAYVHCNLQLTTDSVLPTTYCLPLTTHYVPPRVQAGHRVYVHCNGGKGRSAVCTLAYLVSQVSRRQ